MVSCLLGFIFSGKAKVVTELYIMRDDLPIDSSLSIVEKNKIIRYIFQKEHRSKLLKHFRRQVHA